MPHVTSVQAQLYYKALGPYLMTPRNTMVDI
jgi:hypothetical protein